jgi:hypothetical protein
MKKFMIFLFLAYTFGVGVVNAAIPCKNCKKEDYSARNSDNNRVVTYKKDGIGRNGVAIAARNGAQKLNQRAVFHRHISHKNK